MLPRQLLASVTGDDIIEMMAFERLEPFGGLADDFRAGQVAATVANVQRGKDDEPYGPDFFMPALRRGRPEPAPVLHDDPDMQAALLDAVLFGKGPMT